MRTQVHITVDAEASDMSVSSSAQEHILQQALKGALLNQKRPCTGNCLSGPAIFRKNRKRKVDEYFEINTFIIGPLAATPRLYFERKLMKNMDRSSVVNNEQGWMVVFSAVAPKVIVDNKEQ